MKWLMRHKFLVVIWVAVFAIGGYVAFSVLGASRDGENNPYTVSESERAANEAKTAETLNNQPKQPQNAKIGQATQDGGLEFTVLGTKDNKETTIGTNVYTQAEATGRFSRLSITIKNIGNTPASLPLAAQKAFIANGEPQSPEADATQYAQADQTKNYWYEQIAPGSTVSGDLIFDLNGNQYLKSVELHATESSPGIKVTLK